MIILSNMAKVDMLYSEYLAVTDKCSWNWGNYGQVLKEKVLNSAHF